MSWLLDNPGDVHVGFESNWTRGGRYPQWGRKVMIILNDPHPYLSLSFSSSSSTRKGLIYFPDFCQIVLERFRENEAEEEEFRKTIFKVADDDDEYCESKLQFLMMIILWS